MPELQMQMALFHQQGAIGSLPIKICMITESWHFGRQKICVIHQAFHFQGQIPLAVLLSGSLIVRLNVADRQ